MSVQNKPDYKIFADGAKPGEVVSFPDVLRGWGVTLDTTGGVPPMEFFNSFGKRLNEWLMYLTQQGISPWEATIDYPKGAIVKQYDAPYISLKATKGESPASSQAAWRTLQDFIIGDYGLGARGVSDRNKPSSSSGAGFYALLNEGYGNIPKNSLLIRFPGTADRFIGCSTDGTNKLFFTDFNGQVYDIFHGGNLSVTQVTGQSTTSVMSQKTVTDELAKKLNAGNVTQVNGSSTSEVMSQKAVSDRLMGIGQSWSDYSGSRNLGSTYSNATSKAIYVCCSVVFPITGTASVTLEVNGVNISQSAVTNTGGNVRGNVNGVIPPGASYKVVASGTTDVRLWAELR